MDGGGGRVERRRLERKKKKKKRAGGVDDFFRELQVAGGRGKMGSPEGNALDRRRRWRRVR